MLLRSGMPVLATCAGVILLRRGAVPAPTASLGVLAVESRNAYGRQIDSTVAPIELVAGARRGPAMEGVFIRAPRITQRR